MISASQDYLYATPRGFVPTGHVLPSRGNAECLVCAEDILFLTEAVQERSSSPSSNSVTPFPEVSHAANLIRSWLELASRIRGLFSTFIDPGCTLSGGSGAYSDSVLPTFTPTTPDFSNLGLYNYGRFRSLDHIRRMFYDIGRLTRSARAFTATYSSGYSTSDFSGGGGQSQRTYDSGDATVTPTVDRLLRASSSYSVSGGIAIIEFSLTSGALTDGAQFKWLAIQFTGNTVPNTGWTGADILSWAKSLGYSESSDYSWSGTAYISKIYFDLVFPAEIGSLNWSWTPS